jgi:hypothetical protein
MLLRSNEEWTDLIFRLKPIRTKSNKDRAAMRNYQSIVNQNEMEGCILIGKYMGILIGKYMGITYM